MTGNTLKRLRTEAGLTQKRLAGLAGVSQAHVAKIEQGKVDPRLSTVNRIMAVLSEKKQAKCKDIMTKGVLFAKPNETILRTSEVMMRNDISQMPVISGNKVLGTITEEIIIKNLRSNLAQEKAKNVMGPPLPTVQDEARIDSLRRTLVKHPGVLVARGREIVGIVTRSDLLKTIA